MRRKIITLVFLLFLLSGCTEAQIMGKAKKVYCGMDSLAIESIEPLKNNKVQVTATLAGFFCEEEGK